MKTLTERLLTDILENLRKLNSNYQEDIDLSGGNFVPGRPFFLYVGNAGNVVGLDQNGTPVDRHMIAGYHPIVFLQITQSGTNATDMAALYF